jgi:hypothetical protein
MKIRKRRFATMAEQVRLPGDKPRPGKCNHPLDKGARFCKAVAGSGTGHPGSGYCVRHDSTAYDPVHRYRRIKSATLRKKLTHLDAVERDVFDLIPEIQLLRSLLLDYIDRFYETQEELHAWYIKQGKLPRRMLDITEATSLVESVGKMIERQHRIASKESISLETFRRVTEAMGIIVARHVREGRALEAIERDWSLLELDTKAPAVPLPFPTTTNALTSNATPTESH